MIIWSSVQFNCSVVSDSLQPHESQHARPPCPSSPTPRVHSDSRPSSQWCHPAISSSVVPFSSCPQIPPSIRVFCNESTLRMRWPKYWSFSFSINMIVLFLVFWETSKMFSIVALPIYILISSIRVFPFLYIFANIFYLWSFWWLPSWKSSYWF